LRKNVRKEERENRRKRKVVGQKKGLKVRERKIG